MKWWYCWIQKSSEIKVQLQINLTNKVLKNQVEEIFKVTFLDQVESLALCMEVSLLLIHNNESV